MAGLHSPSSTDELVDFIGKFVVNQCARTHRSINGALLANAIRDEFPGISYERLGLTKLADAVRLAEERGLVTRHKNVKHLEVSPSIASGTRTVAPNSHSSQYLRPEIWRAFVFQGRSGAHHFDKLIGRLVDNPPPVGVAGEIDRQRYVEINPIGAELQRDWMREFVHASISSDEHCASIDTDDWWIEFPKWLESHDASLVYKWRKFRAERVVRFAEEWANNNHVPASLLFSATTSPHRRPGRAADHVELVRQAILGALNELPLEQLEDIAIPFRYVLHHFKPR